MKRSRLRIGVALSGGGMRGLAHLGVLEVLKEAGIAVDMVAGTSMGGIIGGLYAAGVPLEKMIESAQGISLVTLASADPLWRGVFNHEKLAEVLVQILGNESLTFEDLNIPLAVIAADVETGEPVILDQGPLLPALVATSSVPLLFAPLYHQGRWLIDGGVANNLPVDVVRQLGADRVLGVNVPPRIDSALEEVQEHRGLFLRALLGDDHLQWGLPFLVAEASLDISTRVINRQRMALCPPDLVVEVILPNIGLFSTDKAAEVIEAGRDTARAQIKKLVALQKPTPFRGYVRLLRRLSLVWRALRAPIYPLYPS